MTKDSALVEIRLNSFTGFKKGDLRNRYTSVSRAIVIFVTATVSDDAVVSSSLGVPSHVAVWATSSYAKVGVVTNCTDNQYALKSTAMGIIMRKTSQVNARTAPYSGVARVKYGIM